MRNYATPNVASETRRQPHTLASMWRRLIEPTIAHSEPERRRTYVVATLILTLGISAAAFLVLVVVSTTAEQRDQYVLLIGVLLLFFGLAFYLNRNGHNQAAAGLIVACVIVGSWSAIVQNLASLGSDVIRLSYVAVSVLLSSFLLPTRATMILAATQFAVLFLVSLASPGLTYSTWPSLLGFILFVSVLSVVSNYLSRRDLEQIERQTRQLLESEARLRELSVRDSLTGLFNRRYLEETLERELSPATRKQYPVGIIMIDIDHFKHLNDTHGHAAGDLVLQRVSDALQGHIRGFDIACRYGGEEFILILPEASREVTRERAEQMREHVKGLRVEYRGQVLGPITTSVGVAAFPEHGETGEAVLAQADAALYSAKRKGRDRVVVAN